MFAPINHLKPRLARGETTLGLWVTLESPSITEIAVTLGLDWVVIDTEHGSLDYKEVVEHIRVTRNSTTTPLVRIAEIEPGNHQARARPGRPRDHRPAGERRRGGGHRRALCQVSAGGDPRRGRRPGHALGPGARSRRRRSPTARRWSSP